MIVLEVQLRGGNTLESDNYVGPAKELTIDTEAWNLRLHDGETVGGHVIAKIAELPVNVVQSLNIRHILGISQEDYDAIPQKDPATLYVIRPDMITINSGLIEIGSPGFDILS